MTRDSARQRLLVALDRKGLNRISERLNPEHCDRITLHNEALSDWPARAVRAEIECLLERADT